jgi:hypothetical protein
MSYQNLLRLTSFHRTQGTYLFNIALRRGRHLRQPNLVQQRPEFSGDCTQYCCRRQQNGFSFEHQCILSLPFTYFANMLEVRQNASIRSSRHLALLPTEERDGVHQIRSSIVPGQMSNLQLTEQSLFLFVICNAVENIQSLQHVDKNFDQD